jgi:hypothetical protein
MKGEVGTQSHLLIAIDGSQERETWFSGRTWSLVDQPHSSARVYGQHKLYLMGFLRIIGEGRRLGG